MMDTVITYLCVVIIVSLHLLNVYLSYLIMPLFYEGVKYRLILPATKSILFFLFCYTSIVTDIVLFNVMVYRFLVYKNMIILAIFVVAFAHAFNERKLKDG